MADKPSKPNWKPSYTPNDTQVNLDALWNALEAIMPSDPNITTDVPDTKEGTVGSALSLAVVCGVASVGTLSYQWQKLNGTTWSNVSGATSATYTIASYASANAGSYRCLIKCTFNNIVASAYSNTCVVSTAS